VVSFAASAAAASRFRQPNGRVQLQHDVVPVRRAALRQIAPVMRVGIGHRIVDRVSQFTEQVFFQVIVEFARLVLPLLLPPF